MRGRVLRPRRLVDIFPPSERRPYRIEFVGDTIESIRRYDPSSSVRPSRLARGARDAPRDRPR